jgi:hypothetical protein
LAPYIESIPTGSSFVILDPSHQEVRDLTEGVITDFVSNYLVGAVYLDYWSGVSSVLNYRNGGGGNYWSEGKRLLGKQLKDNTNLIDPDFIVSSESLEENLVDVVDLVFSTPIYSTPNDDLIRQFMESIF